jgi:septum formation protein
VSDETDPTALVRELALRKARALASKADPNDVVLGADTIVVLDGAILGKPRDAADAMAMLGALRGRQHEVVTGVAVCANDEDIVDAVTSRVTMREYAAAEVAFYVAGGSPLDKAGAYAIQDAAFAPVADCDGCECSVMGLPLWTVAYMLTRAGVRALDAPTFERCADCPERRDQP